MKTTFPLLLFLLDTYWLGNTFDLLKKKTSESTYILCIGVRQEYHPPLPYTVQPKLLQ